MITRRATQGPCVIKEKRRVPILSLSRLKYSFGTDVLVYITHHQCTPPTAYLAPPTVHVSLATLETNVSQRTLDVTFNVTVTSNTGFTVRPKKIKIFVSVIPPNNYFGT